MTNNSIARIEWWFAGEHQDSDFYRVDRLSCYRVFGPTADCNRIIYCTKLTVAFPALECNPTMSIPGLICQIGLPREDDMQWLPDIIGHRQLFFLGDLDPVDVMIFAWLRHRLAPIEVVHGGINDSYIAALDAVVPENYRIGLKSTELAAVAELRNLVPDAREFLGPTCYGLLNDGYKIELEAIQSVLGSAGPMLSAVIDYERNRPRN